MVTLSGGADLIDTYRLPFQYVIIKNTPKKHPSVRFLVKRTLLSDASCAGLTSRITKSLIKLKGHGLMQKANLRGGSSLSGDNHTDTSRGDENAQPSRKPWVLGVEFSDSKHDCTTSVTVRG